MIYHYVIQEWLREWKITKRTLISWDKLKEYMHNIYKEKVKYPIYAEQFWVRFSLSHSSFNWNNICRTLENTDKPFEVYIKDRSLWWEVIYYIKINCIFNNWVKI